ncbi:uncharacterized protein N7482_007074 [Penicillium canariense]|uniref:Zn(2)-C6 fungal-type domain-containing protein n=1 Tax=Penicillium canariense TaxID=189055 RepID=A0A9W9LJI9_9EURO|nr:uncharacterized protein N7482_007074 [Penicillium canariense]KAJ5160070.1 hypothetical protein N7482_007074 [Penicillium canariense]
MPKPAFVIVPGAWHRPQHYRKLINGLANFNYEAVGVTMPSVDSSPPHPSWDQDAQAVRRVIMKYLNAGTDVITVAHSFGGVAMSEAVKGLGKQDREREGHKGSVRRLVYMCAMALPKGQTHVGQLVPVTPEEEEIERKRQELAAKYGGMKFTEDGAMVLEGEIVQDILYSRCDPKDAQEALSMLGSFPAGPLTVPATYSAFKEIPSTYIVCKNDNALPACVQRRMIAQGEGAFDVEECDEGHSPFLSNPSLIVDHATVEVASTPAKPPRRQNTSCDPCRRSKRRCFFSHRDEGDDSASCTHCQRLGHACTFDFATSQLNSRPKKRQRRKQQGPSHLPGYPQPNIVDKASETPVNCPRDSCQNGSTYDQEDFSSWLNLDVGQYFDDISRSFATDTYSPTTSLAPAHLDLSATSEPRRYEREALVPSRSHPAQSALTLVAGQLLGSTLRSPVYLLTSRLNATIIDERLARIYETIVTGSASRFLDYDSNLYATGYRYQIENSSPEESQESSPARIATILNENSIGFPTSSPQPMEPLSSCHSSNERTDT